MSDNPKCKCNWHLGMGPNLLCPEHGKREDLGLALEKRNKTIVRMENAQNDFNAAIDYALSDDCEGQGLLFLEIWREGDWQGIQDSFPEFKISDALLNAQL
jgi:hypothetical protein